jgi:hypothetical protein
MNDLENLKEVELFWGFGRPLWAPAYRAFVIGQEAYREKNPSVLSLIDEGKRDSSPSLIPGCPLIRGLLDS